MSERSVTGGQTVALGRDPIGAEVGRKGRLRTLHVIAASLLAALVPLILAAGLWLRQELDQNRRDVEATLHAQAEDLSQRLDSGMQQQMVVLQSIAALPALDGPDLQSFHVAASRMLQAMPEWAAIWVVEPGTRKPVLSTLHALGEPIPETASPDAVEEAARLRRPVIRSRAEGEGGLYAARTVMLYAPVIRNGAVGLVLAAAMRAEAVQDLLMQGSGDGSVLSVAIDENGRILARSRNPEQFAGRPANDSFRRQTQEKPAGSFTATTLDGQQVFTSFQRSAITGWSAVAAVDRREFDQLTRRPLLATVAAGGLSLTLAGVLAVFLLSHVMERRISDERFAASRALSDLDARLLAKTRESLEEQRKAASEREVLLREIYHRVKNNLQIIQSLLRLGSRDLTPEQRDPFEDAIRRIGAMARVHTLLYTSSDLSSIDLKEYIDGLLREVSDAFGASERGIEPVLDAQSMPVPLDTAVPLAFIAVELLTNSFKHAFPEDRTGHVRVSARSEGGTGILTVEDDGVGVQPPVGGRRPLGLTIVTKLVQQIGGTLETPAPGGSRYQVTFPLAVPVTGSPRLDPPGA